MLPLTVSFETVLQIFNNNFKQEEVKVGLFANMRKDSFVSEKSSLCVCMFSLPPSACIPICICLWVVLFIKVFFYVLTWVDFEIRERFWTFSLWLDGTDMSLRAVFNRTSLMVHDCKHLPCAVFHHTYMEEYTHTHAKILHLQIFLNKNLYKSRLY